jgi:ubiquitin C-terminal hydrolase
VCSSDLFVDALGEALDRAASPAPYRELDDAPGASDGALADEAWAYFSARSSSALSDAFRGQMRAVTRCGECGFASRSFDAFEELLLPFSRGAQVAARGGGADAPPLRLEDLLAAACASETLEADGGWLCPRCRKRTRATRDVTVHRAPRVLVLVLKRFYFTKLRRCKVDAPVELPPDPLALAPLMAPDAPGRAAALYDLIAVVNHMGDTSFGHYTADARAAGGAWSTFNDARVSPALAPTRRASSSPYVLFYRRRGGESF